MGHKYKAILIIANNLKVREFIMACLCGEARDILWASCLSDGINLLNQYYFDAIFFMLPPVDVKNALDELMIRSQMSPVIAINEIRDNVLAAEVLHCGAQDFLVKGQFDSYLLLQSLHFSVERQKVLKKIHVASEFDELTGLYNRRGLLTLASYQLRIAERTQKDMMLVFADIDNMKWINDTFGHQIGDEAIIRVAEVLRSTFRSADIVSRFGGDEFVVVAFDFDADFSGSVLKRLEKRLEEDEKWPTISLSTGFAIFDPDNPSSIEELITHADRMMYEYKWSKRKNAIPNYYNLGTSR